jgi:hypothetical protein
VVDVLAEPPRPTEDKLMRVSPGWEVDRFDYLHVNCEYYDLDGIVRTWTHGDNRLVKQRWILRKRPDWAYYQRENAEKWLEENYPTWKLTGLERVLSGKSVIVKWGNNLSRVHENPTYPDSRWLWVVEPKESVKEYALTWDSNYIRPMIIFHLRKICVSELSKGVFNGFKYADGFIEADFKRIRNGQVEWAVGVKVKE